MCAHTCVRHVHTFYPSHALHASFNFVSFTWESSWLTHVWEAMLLTHPPPLAHVTIKGCSHMCEHLAPFDWSKTLIHVELTWPSPHRSWEILALHLAFDLSRPLHLISYKRRALSSFQQKHYLPHGYAAGFVSNHISWVVKSSTLNDFCEVCIGVFWIVYALCLFHVAHLHVFFHILRFAWIFRRCISCLVLFP